MKKYKDIKILYIEWKNVSWDTKNKAGENFRKMILYATIKGLEKSKCL